MSRSDACEHFYRESSLMQTLTGAEVTLNSSLKWVGSNMFWTYIVSRCAPSPAWEGVWKRPNADLHLDGPRQPWMWEEVERVALGKQQAMIGVKVQGCLFFPPPSFCLLLLQFLTSPNHLCVVACWSALCYSCTSPLWFCLSKWKTVGNCFRSHVVADATLQTSAAMFCLGRRGFLLETPSRQTRLLQTFSNVEF